MASLAAAAAQRRRADPMLLAQLLVEREHVRWHADGDTCTPPTQFGRLFGDLGQRRVASRRSVVTLAGEPRLLSGKRRKPTVYGFTPLHDVKHDLLKIGLPAVQRLDLGLEIPQLTRRRDLARVKALSIAVYPGPDLLDVPFSLGLFPGQVAHLGLSYDNPVPKFGGTGVQPLHLSELGQPATTMIKPTKLGVEVREFKQAQLLLRRCFHGSPR